MIFNSSFGGKALPILTNPGASSDLLEGKQLIDQDGNPLTGTLPTKTSSDLTASGSSIIVPAGYYSEQASKSVATATQATPSISVSTAGLITASSTQSAGYVAAGTKSATSQLTTQAGKTVTPSTSTQTAVSSGRYTTGTVYVAGDADLKAANIKSGVNIFGVTGTLTSGASATASAGGNDVLKSYLSIYGDFSSCSKVIIIKTNWETNYEGLDALPRAVGCYIYLGHYIDFSTSTIYTLQFQGRDYEYWQGYWTDDSSDFSSIVSRTSTRLRVDASYAYGYYVEDYFVIGI